MNKKGFTIIELLAVLVILAVVSLITTTVVSSILKDSKETLSKRQKENIEKTAETYYLKEGMNYGDTCVNVQELIDKGYFEVATITDPKNRSNMSGSVEIIYKSNHYTYKYNEELCKTICEAVTESEYGNVPTGEYLTGDEYICDPGDGIERTFLVLEDGDTTTLTTGRAAQAGEVSLIMSNNIYESTSLYSDDAIEYVETQLTDWNSVLVSIATANQIAAVVGKTPPSFSDVSLTSAPWLYTNLASDEIYWSTSDYVTGAGKFKDSNWGIATGTNAGVRPVITLSKNDIG